MTVLHIGDIVHEFRQTAQLIQIAVLLFNYKIIISVYNFVCICFIIGNLRELVPTSKVRTRLIFVTEVTIRAFTREYDVEMTT